MKEWQKYYYKVILFFESSHDVKFDTIFVALWVFTKGVFIGVIIDLLADIAVNGYQIYQQMNVGTIVGGQDLFINIKIFFSNLSPDLVIHWPYYILAFAAGRMATKMSDIASYMLSWIILYIAIVNFHSDITSVIILIGIYGFGTAYTSAKNNDESRRNGGRINHKGSFNITFKVLNKKVADKLLNDLDRLIAEVDYCNVISHDIVRLLNNKNPHKYEVKLSLIGNRYYLPQIQEVIHKLYGNTEMQMTDIASIGGKFVKM